MKKTSQLTLFAILLSISLVLHYIEGFFSIPMAGFMLKIGLSNIVVVYYLSQKQEKNAFFMSVCKVIMALLFSPSINFSNFLISLGGAFLSLVIMIFIHRIYQYGLILTSIGGGIFHNFGQLLVVLFLLRMRLPFTQIVYFIPLFIVLGTISGFLVGTLAKLILSKLGNIPKKSDYNNIG